MKNLLCRLLIVAAAFVPLGCKSARNPPVTRTVEEAPSFAPVVHTNDPKTAGQLASGFYGIEGNAWRWSAPKFAVILRPPAGAAERGATLELQFTVPQSNIDALKSVTLAAKVGGQALEPETFTRAGQYTYRREVGANALSGPRVRVDFQLDKSMLPGGGDRRELGVVVLSAGLVSK